MNLGGARGRGPKQQSTWQHGQTEVPSAPEYRNGTHPYLLALVFVILASVLW